MLGEQIGSDKGKITLRRVLHNDVAPTVEVNFESAGQILGMDTQQFGTYESQLRPDGTLFGSGQGVVMSKTGEKATWKGQGVGTFKEDGSISFRGAVYYYSQDKTFSRLNNVAVVFEHEVGADNSIENKIFEWR